MRYLKCFFIVSGLLPWTLAAQDYTDAVVWKNPFDIPRSEHIEKLTTNAAGAPLILSTYDRALLIRPVDATSGLPKKLLSIRSNDKKSIEQYKHHGDSIFALVRSHEKEKSDLYETVIYTLTGDSLAEAYRNEVAIPQSEAKKSNRPIFFTTSDNGKYSLTCRQLAFDKGKATVFVEITSFSQKKNQHFELPTSFDGDDLEVLGASVDNQGIAYFAAKTGIKLNSPFRRKFLIYSFNRKTKELHEFDLSSDKVFLQDLIIKTYAHGIMVLSLYANDPFAQDESNGFAFVQIDSLGAEIVQKRIHPYSKDMVMIHQGEQSDDIFIDNLFIDNIFNCSGTPIFIVDKRYRDQVCTTDPRTGIMTCTDQFHFDGITIENVADPARSTTIKRRQIDYERVGPYVSQQSFVLDDRVIVLFNDHFKSDDATERIMNNPSRSVMRYASLSLNGEVFNTSLTHERQSDFIFMPIVPGYQRQDRITVLSSNGRSFRMGEIQLDRLR